MLYFNSQSLLLSPHTKPAKEDEPTIKWNTFDNKLFRSGKSC